MSIVWLARAPGIESDLLQARHLCRITTLSCQCAVAGEDASQERNTPWLDRLLLVSLRLGKCWELLTADEPLKVRLLPGWPGERSGRWMVLGFGANLLAEVVFLDPITKLLASASQRRWGCGAASYPWLNCRQWLRSQHV